MSIEALASVGGCDGRSERLTCRTIMFLAVALTVAYLAVNWVLMVWLERQRARGSHPPAEVEAGAAVLRYGPPAAGFLYLVAIAGDWAFFGFVAFFFATAAWLMSGLAPVVEADPDRVDPERDRR